VLIQSAILTVKKRLPLIFVLRRRCHDLNLGRTGVQAPEAHCSNRSHQESVGAILTVEYDIQSTSTSYITDHYQPQHITVLEELRLTFFYFIQFI
jgi:hypothetical protein